MITSDMDTTSTDWSEFNRTDDDQSRMLESSEFEKYLPGKGRASQNRQQLAAELMREYRERQRRPKSKMNQMFDKFLLKK